MKTNIFVGGDWRAQLTARQFNASLCVGWVGGSQVLVVHKQNFITKEHFSGFAATDKYKCLYSRINKE